MSVLILSNFISYFFPVLSFLRCLFSNERARKDVDLGGWGGELYKGRADRAENIIRFYCIKKSVFNFKIVDKLSICKKKMM